jgi:phospholipase C
MHRVFRGARLAWLMGVLAGGLAQAQISSFQHVILLIQENRTPDVFFQGLCTTAKACSTTPSSAQYNIQTRNWLDKTQASGVIQPLPTALNAGYDNTHSLSAFKSQCDLNKTTGVCKMDGAAGVTCSGPCPTQPQFRYVDNSNGALDPDLELVAQYGWANYMFQTNEGPSFPAHLFLFGATSAPTAADDAAGIFASGNLYDNDYLAGCIGPAGARVPEISPPDKLGSLYPCFEHNTVPDVLPANISWKYYAPSGVPNWNAPSAIQHICQPSEPTGGECTGAEWINSVDLRPADVLSDIKACKLRGVSWVIPIGQNSDHGGPNDTGGPAWIASVVNAVGESKCTNSDGSSYWDSTAILVTWDDWGGWYDHVPPTILPLPQGDFQYGFRVPLIVISAYTPAGLIDNNHHDFGSIIRFIESNFGVSPGVLNFADARASDQLATFFNLTRAPRPFVTIPAALSGEFFIHDTRPPGDPDSD